MPSSKCHIEGDILVTRIFRVRSNAYVVTVATSVSMQFFALLQGMLLARMLGPDGRGEVAGAMLWPNIFGSLGGLGISFILARRAGSGDEDNRLTALAFGGAIITGSISVASCYFALPLLIPGSLSYVISLSYIYLLYIPFSQLGANLLALDHGAGRFGRFNFNRALLSPLYLIALVLVWRFAQDKVIWVIVAMIGVNALAALLRLVYRFRSLLSGAFSVIRFGELVRESMPFLATNIILVLYEQADKAILMWAVPVDQLGFYTVAASAIGVAKIIPQGLALVMFSVSNKMEPGKGFGNLAGVVRRGFLVTGLSAIVVWSGLAAFVKAIYGEEFAPAIQMAEILLLGVITAGGGEIITQALRGQGRPLTAVSARIAGLISVCLLALWLAKRDGARGVAVAAVSGELTSFAVLIFLSRYIYEDFRIQDLIPRLKDVGYILSRGK